MTHPRQHLHPSVRLAQALRGIAGSWDDLQDALGRRGTSSTSGRVTGSSQHPLPIDVAVSDLMREISEWAAFLARTLADETDWRPPADPTTPALLRALAQRPGHFTEHADEALATAVQDDADDYRRRVTTTLEPTGARWVPLHTPCPTTNPPCPGQLRARLEPNRWDALSDLICDHDPTHRTTPDQWQRTHRAKTHTHDDAWLRPDEAATLLGITESAVWSRAQRQGWARRTHGRTTTYARADITRHHHDRRAAPPHP